MRAQELKLGIVFGALLLAGIGAHSLEPTYAEPQALWVAERDGVLKIASEDGRVVFELDVIDARSVAVDSGRGVVWIYRPGELIQFRQDGSRRLSLKMDRGSTTTSALVVHPEDGSAWLAEERYLQSVGYDGQRFRSIELSSPVGTLAIDADRSRLWVGHSTGLTVLDPITGAGSGEIALGESVSDLAVEPQSGAAWALSGDRLWRVEDPTQLPEARIDLLGASSIGLANNSRLFVARGGEVLALHPNGRAVWSQVPAAPDRAIDDLVVSPDGETLWAASADRVVKLSGDGRVLARLAFDPPLEVRSLSLDWKQSAAERFGLERAFQPIDPQAVVFPDLRGRFVTVAVPSGVLPSRAYVELRASGGRILRTARADGNGRTAMRVEARVGEELFLSARDPESGALYGTPILLARDQEGFLQPPPNPADIANLVDPTLPYHLHENVRFLWDGSGQGSQVVQDGVQPGSIAPYRAMVLRGRVFDVATQQPIDGVQVSAVEFGEYGTTQSRLANGAGDLGRYDFAVQGGGWITLEFSKTGYRPIRRKRQLPRRRFLRMPDVYMTPLSTKLTELDSGMPAVQVAEGDENTDDDGSRTLRFFFPPGISATQVMPDGTQQLLTDFTLRATEFTVGDNGPEAMPAPLPPNSGYTFAFEATITEAEAAGAESVTFDDDVVIYAENFLDIPICASNPPDPPPPPPCEQSVPVGYYDETEAKWVPSEDGMVIDKVGVDGLRAQLDVDGDNIAEDPAFLLTEYGITDEELQQVQLWFPTNQSLWRVTTDHFSVPDWNWGFGIPAGAIPPPDLGRNPHPDEERPDCQDGSIIECQSQHLREALPIVGAPLSLTYASGRAPGRKVERTWDIVYRDVPVGELPSDLDSIVVRIDVAGQQITELIDLSAPDEDGIFEFTWDGLDVYARRVFGGVPAIATVSYVYPGQLLSLGGGTGDGFGGYSGSRVVLHEGRNLVELVKEERKVLYAPVPGPIAGWSLDVVHQYDPYSNILFMGDGRKRNANSLTQTLTRIAGAPQGTGWIVEGDALGTELHNLEDAAIVPDGGYLIAEKSQHRVRKIRVDGWIEPFAGNGQNGIGGDGGLAVDAFIGNPISVAAAPDGSVYICHVIGGPFTEDRRLRRVRPDGIIELVAEDTSCQDLAVSPDGRVYYSAGDPHHSIYRLEETGEIFRVAGDGTPGDLGDGGSVIGSRLNGPGQIAFSPAGSLFIVDTNNRRIREITTDGIIRTVAGDGSQVVSGDGGPAPDAGLGNSVKGVEVSPEGRLSIAALVDQTGGFYSVREVGAGKIIRTVAGADSTDPLLGDGGPAVSQKITNAVGLTLDPEGRLVIVERGFGQFDIDYGFISRLGGLLPVYEDDVEYALASESGDEIYFFDAFGRHEFTTDALTGARLWDPVYDESVFPPRLVEVIDVDGRKTTIERDATGAPTAIVSPDGQRTDLLVDAFGWLQGVQNPALETYKFKNTIDGLLEELEPPDGSPRKTVTYDALGRLERVTDREGGYKELILGPSVAEDSYEVGLTTAMARTTVYQVAPIATGGQKRTRIAPTAVETIRTILPDGSTTLEYPEPDDPPGTPRATTVTWREGPDPRLGMVGPIIDSFSVTTPNGKTATLTTERTMTLVDPDDITSLDTQVDTIDFNGKASILTYTRTDPDPANLGGSLSLTTAGGRTVDATLDEKGRVEQVQFATYAPIDYFYDPVSGRLTSVTQHLRSVSYDYYDDMGPRHGFLKTITDPLMQSTTFDWDSAGRVTSQTLPDAQVVGFGYDANGNLMSVTPPGRPAHLFHYTLDDWVDGYQAPAPDPGSGPAVTQSIYNLDDQIETMTRPDGKVVDPQYGQFTGRLEKVTVPHGLPPVPGDYVFAYEPVTGKLSMVTDPDLGTLTYDYDGPLVTGVTWTGEVDGTVSVTYTDEFWLDTQTVDAGGSLYPVTYSYDDDGLFMGVVDALSVVREDTPNTGQLKSTTLGIITDDYDYDDDYGELKSYSVTNGTDVLYSYTIDSRDELGRILQKTETFVGESSKVYVYDYDVRGRLIKVTVDGIVTEQYDYSDPEDGPNSNRTSWTLGSTTYTASYDDQDRLTSYGAGGTEDITFGYSDNGEL